MARLSNQLKEELIEILKTGDKLKASRAYREATGATQDDAQRFIIQFARDNPVVPKKEGTAEATQRGGCAGLFFAVIAIGFVILLNWS